MKEIPEEMSRIYELKKKIESLEDIVQQQSNTIENLTYKIQELQDDITFIYNKLNR